MFHKLNVLCEDLDVDAADTYYTDVLDTGYANVGDVEPLILEIWSGIAAAGSGTLDITLETSIDVDFSSPIAVFSLPQKAAADLPLGKVFEGAIPTGLSRYLRLKLITTTGFTSGKALITAAIRNRG